MQPTLAFSVVPQLPEKVVFFTSLLMGSNKSEIKPFPHNLITDSTKLQNNSIVRMNCILRSLKDGKGRKETAQRQLMVKYVRIYFNKSINKKFT